MKKFKRIASAVLAATVAVTALSACGGEKGGESKIAEISFNETGYPIVNEPVTLTMVGKTLPQFGAWKDLLCFKEMETLTGVTMDTQEIDFSVYDEKRNLMFGSDELPDVFFKCDFTPSDLTLYGSQGMLIPLEDLIDEYAPNLKKLMEENEEVVRAMTSSDGHIYGLPKIGSLYVPNVTRINDTWLKALGLEIPKNSEELYNVLKAFKEQDPNGNGKNDEIPLSMVGVSAIKDCLFPMFDIVSDALWMSFEDGKAVFHPETENYVEGIKYFNKLYKEGLLDVDTFTQQSEQVRTKTTAGMCTVGMTRYAELATNSDNDYATVFPLENQDGEPTCGVYNLIKQGGFVITKACKYPEVAMRWIDYLYSEEGGKLFMCGKEGTTYEMNDDGTWHFIKEGDLTDADVRYRDTFAMGSNYATLEPADFFNKLDPGDSRGEQERIALTPQYKEICKVATPIMFYSADDQKKINALSTDISQYISESTAKFIIGQMDIEKDYDAFIKNLKEIGIDEVVEIYQRTYDNVK